LEEKSLLLIIFIIIGLDAAEFDRFEKIGKSQTENLERRSLLISRYIYGVVAS